MQGQVYEKKMKFAFKYTLFEGTETKQNKTIASRQLTGKLDLGEQSKKKKKGVVGTGVFAPSSDQPLPFSAHVAQQGADVCRLLT